MPEILLQVEKIGLQLGGRDLFKDLSFSLCAGEIVGLRAPSGAGKSSLLRCLSGAETAYEGTYQWNCAWAEIPQHLALNPELSAWENLQVALAMHKGSGFFSPGSTEQKKRAYALLEHFQISADASTELLSGGEAQRLAVVRALLAPWRVLLADEAAAHLDEDNAKKVLQALKEEALLRKGALLVVQHESNLLEQFATRFLPWGKA